MEEQKAAIPPPTEKDKEMIIMLKSGMKGRDIADKMGLNKNTFAFTLKVLRSKYSCNTTTQLVAYFIENNLLSQ